MTSTNTPWPDGVIARYLTVGGATVDLTEDEISSGCFHTCTGCGDYELHTDPYNFGTSTTDRDEHRRERALDVTRRSAQQHAETCRAIPKPAEQARS